jgi:hypothetical protein
VSYEVLHLTSYANSLFLEQRASSGDDTDDTGEEGLEGVKADQTKEEAKVKAAAAELQDKLDQCKKVRVGDIRGKWKLFSS